MSHRTLVIGGGGFIGSHLVPVLLSSGREVTVLGRSSIPRCALPPEARYVSGDFSCQPLLDELLDGHDEIVHLAYATVPNTSFDNPLADLIENLSPTVRLFSAIAENGRRLVLVSSGGTVYGEARALPISEEHPTEPISPYGVTKLTVEKYAHLFAITRNLKVAVVRPANAYGEGQKPFSGQGFVATAMASIMRGYPVRVFGAHGVVRDYIHVHDIATGILSVLSRGKTGEVYNLGSGIGRSNFEVIGSLCSVMGSCGRTIEIQHEAGRPFDVQANILDCGKLSLATGWQPSVQFEEGLARAHLWLKSHGC